MLWGPEQKFMKFRGGKIIPATFISAQRALLTDSPSRSIFLVRTGRVYTRELVVDEKMKEWYVIFDKAQGQITVSIFPQLFTITVPQQEHTETLVQNLISCAVAQSLLERSDVFLDQTLTLTHPLEVQALAKLQIAGVRMLRSTFGIAARTEIDPPVVIPEIAGLLRIENAGGILVHAIKFTHSVPLMRLDGLRPPSDDMLFTLDSMTSRDGIPEGLKRARQLATIAPAEQAAISAELLIALGIGPGDIDRIDKNRLEQALAKRTSGQMVY
jgi:hypothetical protein